MSDTCKCGRPTREGRSFCETCADDLAYALGEVPWLEEQLEITTTRSKGVDYRTRGGTPSGERPSPVVWSATDARINLRGFLIAWVKFCHDNDIRNSSPTNGMPAGDMPTLTALSRYLMWRVDGLALTDQGPAAVEQITSAVAKGKRLIDKAPDKQYLGDCTECDGGRLYARRGDVLACCNTCGSTIDAQALRGYLLASLEDRLCTADEIAQLSTHLGLKADREQVRKHVEYLGRKGAIAKHPAISDQAVYQFGEVYKKLVDKDYGKKTA